MTHKITMETGLDGLECCKITLDYSYFTTQ